MSEIEREPVFDPVAFGRSIRVLLAELNIQQREAARMMGVDKCVLNRICKHGNPPSVENYLRITAWMNGSRARSQSERVSRLEEALQSLVKLHDKFMRAQNGFMGNQADAYNIIASRFPEWDRARSALNHGADDGR